MSLAHPDETITQPNLNPEALHMMLPDHIREVFAKATCLYSKSDVEAALDKMSLEISHKLSQTNPIFLCVVVGGIVPLGNLLPAFGFSIRGRLHPCDALPKYGQSEKH